MIYIFPLELNTGAQHDRNISPNFFGHCEKAKKTALGLPAAAMSLEDLKSIPCLNSGPVKDCLQTIIHGKSTKKKKGGGKGRMAVSAEAGAGDEDAPSGEVKVYPKSEQVRDQILAATMGNTLFAGITMEQRESVVDAMFEVKCKPAQVVIAEGDMGE